MPRPRPVASTITGIRLGDLLGQLCAALGRPFGTKGEGMVPVYLRSLEEWPAEAIEWAVWRACKTWKAKSFPKPAELADLCAQSPYPRLPARTPTEPVRPDTERCPRCREWWGWHRVVSLGSGTPILLILTDVRHREDCPGAPHQAAMCLTYRWTWVDGLPDVGVLAEGGEAWKAAGAVQLIDPLPAPRAAATPRPPSARLPFPKPRAPVPIAQVIAPIDAGDSWEPVPIDLGL